MELVNSILIDKLKNVKRILFFTGAGISAESGIPTFRGEDGIWKKFKPEELANFNAFQKNPEMVWEWYQYRRKIINEFQPNKAHFAIAEFQNYFDEVIVSTQNIDNLHRRAGSKIIYELHGNIEKNYCIKCKKRYDFNNFNFDKKIQMCECGGLIRPDVVWFGEFLPMNDYNASERAAKECDITFVIGTSAVVYPAANIPLIAKSNHKFVVEINIEPTEISPLVNVSLIGKAGKILPQILEELKGQKFAQ